MATTLAVKTTQPALTQLLSEKFDASTVVLTGSGTQALQLALAMAPPFRAGSAVVAMPAYSCFDLVSAAVGAGVGVRFYDVDPVTLSPDLDHLGAVIAQGVSAVLGSSLYGYPVDWPALRAECTTHGLFLIEDAAQGVGTEVQGHRGGASGDVSILSFGRGKGWTGGGGGALLLRGGAEGLVVPGLEAGTGFGLRAATITAVAWAMGRPTLFAIPASVPQLGLGETTYHDPRPPREMDGFSASLAASTEPSATAATARRTDAGRRWSEALLGIESAVDDLLVCRPVGGPESASFLRYAVVLRDETEVARVCAATRRLGVARGYPTALNRLPQAAGPAGATAASSLPGADRLASKLITLPTHHWVTASDVEAVVRHIRG